MVPLMIIYFIIQKFYRASYIEMQRIDATTRSPIYAHFSETLTGVETLRAYGFEERFALSNEHKVDYNHRCGCCRFPSLQRSGNSGDGSREFWSVLCQGHCAVTLAWSTAFRPLSVL
jgi:ABC-type multidrug transport system fused ATPase/permease subunit